LTKKPIIQNSKQAMQTLQISLPDDIASVILSLNDEQSQFIVEAVREKLARQQRATLEAILIEGYQATRAEDRIITEDFELTTGDRV
jgi:hypothetical protein